MATLADLKRTFLLASLGITESDASNNDLLYELLLEGGLTPQAAPTVTSITSDGVNVTFTFSDDSSYDVPWPPAP